MASVDYNQYVRQYGQSLDTSGIQRGIDSFMKNRKEAIVHKAKELSNKTYSAMVAPWEETIAGDVSEEGWALKASNLANKTPGQALAEYQAAAKLKGDKVYNQLLSSGAFDPKTFNENYKANIATYMPELEMKLESYKKNNHLSKKEMRKFIKDNNLTKLLQKYGKPEGALREMTYGDETWKHWATRKKDDYGLVRMAPGALGVTGVAKSISSRGVGGTAKALFGGLTSPKATGLERIVAGEGMVGKRLKGSKYVTGMDKILAKNEAKAKNIITKSQSIRDKAYKTFAKGVKQKGLKPAQILKNFEASAAGKNHVNKVVKAGKLAVSQSDKATKGAWAVIQKKLKEKGADGLVREIAKKAGWKTAAKMGARLGIAGLATASGVGTAVGIGMNVALVYDLYKILSSE